MFAFQSARQARFPNPLLAHARSHWFRCLLLVIVGFLVRTPALQGLPVWDDHWLINENPFIRSVLLMAEAFRHYLFLDGFSAHYRPVQNISFALDYLIWNSDPYGYHLTNVLLHLASGLLLYFLLGRLFAQLLKPAGGDGFSLIRRESTVSLWAFLVALVWIVHPVHSAAIDYISGRADSLAFLFACGGWLLYLRARTQATRRLRIAYYLSAGLCGMLALCSREIAAVWLCLFLLHMLLFEVGRKAKMISFVCCVLLLGSYAGLRQLPTRQARAVEVSDTAPPVRAVLMLRALGDYGRLMVWPAKLRMERNVADFRNYTSTSSWRQSVETEYLSILGLIVLCALGYGASRKGPAQPLRLFGAIWFLLSYLPISNLVELNATVAEHWLYLPSVGFLIFLAGIVLEFPVPARKLSVAVACVGVCALSTRAYIRSTDWVTPKTFFQRTMAAGGGTRAAVNLGLIYAREGDFPKAEALFRRVLELSPDYPVARNALANVLYRQGKRAEGEAIFDASRLAASEKRHEHPHTWIAALNLARIQHQEGNDTAALALLEQARPDFPQIWELVGFEAEVLRQTKGPDAALRLVAEFARDNWWHHGASISLGRLLAEKGEVEEAVSALRFASWLDLHDAEALNLLAAIRLRQNRLEEACLAQTRALSRQPDEPRQYRLLSDILFKMGRGAEAQLALAKIASLEALAQSQVAVN